MNEQTSDRLYALRLPSMADKLKELSKEPKYTTLPWMDALAMLVDAEYDSRSSKRIASLLKKARMKYSTACLEDLRYDPARNLKKEVVRELRSCRFLSEAHNILISGATGTGKSYLGCALGNLACRNGYRVSYYRVSVFLDAMMAERALGTYAKALEKLRKVKLLILDDLSAGKDLGGSVGIRNAVPENVDAPVLESLRQGPLGKGVMAGKVIRFRWAMDRDEANREFLSNGQLVRVPSGIP